MAQLVGLVTLLVILRIASKYQTKGISVTHILTPTPVTIVFLLTIVKQNAKMLVVSIKD